MKTMKKPTIFKALIAVMLFLLSFSSDAQVRKNFKTEYANNLNGDILVIGNNILNRHEDKDGNRANDPFDDTSKVNDNFEMKYINVDKQSTFNSSSATLTIPPASKGCFEIEYAALYWAGTYQGTDRSIINTVKLKVPNGTYTPITGTVIYDEGEPGVDEAYASKPYACFKEITDEVKAAKEGVYTIGDIVCSEGKITPGGNSGGWTLFVVYKDPLLPNRFITSFNGFGIIKKSDPPLILPISGFRTNLFGDVNAKLGFSALEGDASLKGDGLEIKGAKSAEYGNISSLVRPIAPGVPASGPWWNYKPAIPPTPNFFNSTITDGDVILAGRVPNSINTLGYDAGVIKIDNNKNAIIQNDETDANLRISTSSDSYYLFFNALSVEIIAPKIVLKKNALDKDNKNINGQPVALNQEIQYEINFRNEGNDDATNFTITDELPKNVIFGGLSTVTKDPRIVATYDDTTRKLVFTIPDAMVVANGPLTPYSIKFKVRVVDDCNELIDACANKIENIAYSKYYGVKNTSPNGFGEGSYSSISACNIGEPTATNFLVGIEDCLFSRDVSLCGTTTLTAALGYTTYVWRDPNGVIFGGNNRIVTISKPGKYTVNNSGAANCEPIQQTFNVTDYLAGAIKNPIKGDNIDPATNEAFACVRDLKPFPKIFLCGLNDTRELDTKITGATSIIWQETTDAPDKTVPDSCPNEAATNWNEIGRGAIFTVKKAGVYRLVVNYGNTCVVTHYFNVYQNLLDPKAEKQDIICNTKGSITVTNPPENTGYSYSLDGKDYQTSSVFNDVPKGSYKVQIRQTVLINGEISSCPFFVDVNVDELLLTTDIKATHPICTGDLGTINANINNVLGQYKFVLRKKGSTVEIQNTGLIDDNFKQFTGVQPGLYEVDMSTANNGCFQTKEIEVFDYRLTAEAKITKVLSACGDGEIEVTVKGGTPRPGPPSYYMYYVNGNADYVTNPKIPVTVDTLPADGIYNIEVVDDKGCSVMTLPITVTMVPKPTIDIKTTDVKCYGENIGEIIIGVTPADSGYAVSYSLDGGAYSSISPIKNLAAGKHSLVVKYIYDGVECVDPPREITIFGPDTALTASAGVSELAGCGPAGEGVIRITNPQGGVMPYTYSFDDQKTWITDNWAYKLPGTYTVYIKDNNGCIYPMKDVKIDLPPVAPIIEIKAPLSFNCDGTATTTVTVNNPDNASFEYNYYLDDSTTPNTNVPPNVFPNVTTGDHKVRVEYKLVSVPTYSNLLKEDFGSGADAKIAGINGNYCWEKQDYITDCGAGLWHDYLLNDGEYVVTKKILPDHTADFGWTIPVDHTSGGANTEGRYLAVNIGKTAGAGGIIYTKPIVDIIPGQDIKVEFYALNLLLKANQKVKPNLTVELHKNGVVVPGASVNTADILQNESWNFLDKLSINPGPNTALDFVIRSNSDREDGNDLALDDILVYQLPKSCKTIVEIPFNVPTGKAFTATATATKDVSCATGAADGEITITASNFDTANGYQYSIDGGANWVTTTVTPLIVGGFNAGTFDVRMRFDSTPAGSGCVVTASPTIKAPDVIVADASVKTIARCDVGATITASAIGGSGAYEYELRYAAGGVYRIFQKNEEFLDVLPGDYELFVKDINGCISPAGDPIKIDASPVIDVELDVATDYCYDEVNKATLVVKASGGTGVFSYSLDNDTAQTSHIFKNVEPGLHKIIVIDAAGCKSPEISITIEPELVVTPSVKELDCSSPTTKDAVITGTITGGYLPFTITKVSGPAGTLDQPSPLATGRTFTFTTSNAGDYEFEVKDKNGCTKPLKVKIDPITNPSLKEISKTNVSCKTKSDGSVVLSGENGSGGYKFSDDGTTFTNNTGIFSGLSEGDHTFYVKDSKGCTGQKTVTISAPDALGGSASISIPYTCAHKATISASATGGNGSFTFVLKNGTTVIASNDTGLFENLDIPGTYNVDITDGKGCPLTVPAGTIVALTPPTDMTFSNTALKCPSNTVDVTIESVTGGKGTMATFQYRISLPLTAQTLYQSDPKFTGLAPGNYTFEVKDENDCTKEVLYTIDKLPLLGISSNVDSNVKCLDDVNGSIKYTISGFGNNTPYSYTVDGGTAQTGLFTPATGSSFEILVSGLAAGEHEIIVKNGKTDCEVSKKETVKAPSTKFEINLPTLSPVTCKENGKAIINVVGGWGDYEFTVTPVAAPSTPIVKTSNTFEDLADGDYKVVVKDANGCEVTQDFTIAGKTAVVASIDATSILCYTAAGATIKVSPNTQTNYVYNIIGKATQNHGTFSGLKPGKYTIRVTDTSTECYIDLAEQTVSTELTASTNLIDAPTCKVPSIRIDGEVLGGTQDYYYTVEINGDTTLDPTVYTFTGNTFTYTNNIATTATTQTTYLFKFSDAKGCTTSSTVIVEPKTDPEITSAEQGSIIYCHGDKTGSIDVVINTAKGKGPYTINVKQTSPVSFDFGTQTTGLPAGDYTITVTDDNGCTGTLPAKIKEPLKIEYTVGVEYMKCDGAGFSYGSISVKDLIGGSNVANPGPPVVLDGPFTYTLTNNVGQPTQTAPHNISDARGDYTFNVLNFGIYELTVTDANNCSVTKVIPMASPPEEMDIKITGTKSCTTAELLVSVKPAVVGGPYHFALYPILSGSTPPYEYASNLGSYQDALETVDKTDPKYLQSLFTGLNPGVVYSFIVYDFATNCYYFKQAEVPTESGSTLIPDVKASNVTCMDAEDGKVSFTLSGFNPATTDVKYEIFNSQTNKPLPTPVSGMVTKATAAAGYDIPALLIPGTYYILFTEFDNVGGVDVCINSSKTFTISQSLTPLTLTVNLPKNDNCKAAKGVIEAFGKGGTTIDADPANGIIAVPYLYQIFDDLGPVGYDAASDTKPTAASFELALHTSNTFNKDNGYYIVYVRDAYGCIEFKEVNVLLDPEPEITAVVGNQCTATEAGFSINVNFSSVGIGQHQYSLDGGTFKPIPATAFTISNLSSGKHSVEIRDINGCGNKVSDIEIVPPLTIDADFTTLPVCKLANGTITAEVTGGTTPSNFRYTLVNNTVTTPNIVQLNNPEFLNQAAGNYTITVEDLSTTCSKSTDVDLLIPTDVTFTLENTPPYCTPLQGNDANGTVNVILPVSNDNQPYEFTLTRTVPVGGIPVVQDTPLFTGLTAGTYSVTVKSDRGCDFTDTTTLIAPTAVSATFNQSKFECNGDDLKDKEIEIIPSGGKGGGILANYKYSNNGTTWGDNNIFKVVDNQLTQTVKYYVKDANGCIYSEEVIIAPFPILQKAVAVVINPPMDCLNDQQDIEVTITGGTNTPAVFTYQVYRDGVLIPGLIPVTGNTFVYAAKTAGHFYEFEIFDNNTTCSIMSNAVEVPVFDKIKVTASVFTNVDCNTNMTGQIQINITDYTGPYTYEILQGGLPLTPPVTGVGNSSTSTSFVIPEKVYAGKNYTVSIVETAFPSCPAVSNEVEITEPPVLSGFSVKNENKNCFNGGSRVTIDLTSISGGSGGNTYAFVEDGDSPDLAYGPESVKILDPAVNTEWDVYVKDSKGCVIKQDVTIAEDVSPSGLSVNPINHCPSLTGTYTFTVTATTAGGAEYSIGNGFQPTGTFTVDKAGEYIVTVRDKNGCTNPVEFKVNILQPLKLIAKVSTVPTCNTPSGEVTLQASGGTIAPSYEFSMDGTTYFEDPAAPTEYIFKGLIPGDYKFYVRDKVTKCVKIEEVKIENATLITGFDLKPTAVTCFNSTDGTITAIMNPTSAGVNDNPDYKYSINGGATTQNSPIFTGLAAGPYRITIYSGRGCSTFADTTVGSPDIISVPVPDVVPFACTSGTNTNNFATITVNVANILGGSGDYKTFEFIKVGNPIPVKKGGEPFYVVRDLSGGTYTVNVYDSKGCVGTAPTTVEVKPFIVLDAITVGVTKAITCNNLQEIKVSVSYVGAAAPANLEYTLVDVDTAAGTSGTLYPKQTNTDGIFIGLPVANYLVTVTNLDTGCMVKTYHYVNEPNTFNLKIGNVVNLTCFDDNNGSVDVTFVDRVVSTSPLNPDEAGPFDYIVTDTAGATVKSGDAPNAGPFTISNLLAGEYKITATLRGTPFCSVSNYFTINRPTAALRASKTQSEITCATGNNDGVIVASATGGWPGEYLYELRLGTTIVKGYNASPVFDKLTAGDYTVYVKDGLGCESSVSAKLDNPRPIDVKISATPKLTCFDNEDGVVTIDLVTGGSGNYTFTLHGALSDGSVTVEQSQGARQFTGLKAGTYYVTVNDTWTCTNDSNKVVIDQPEVVKATLEIVTTETCRIAPIVRLTAVGGTGPYYYSADGITYSTVSFNSFVDITLPVTTTKVQYKYFVKDSKDCKSYISNTSEFSPVPNLDFEHTSEIDIKCKGSATGSIKVIAKGGLGNYIYTLQDASGVDITPTPTQLTPGVFTNLSIGEYKVKVTSSDCELWSALIELTQPDEPLVATAVPTGVTCNGYNNGKITVNANGGVGVYKYAIEPEFKQFFDKNEFENLKPGFYDVLVQDENECYVFLKDIEVKEPDQLIAVEIVGSMIPEVCAGDKDGAFSIEIKGGTAPYTESLDNDKGPFLPVTGNTRDYTGLTGGKHIVYIMDSSGCSSEVEINMPLPVVLDPITEVSYHCVDNAQANMVVVKIDDSNDIADVDYSLDGTGTYQPSNVFTNVTPGTHFIVARHTNGCETPTTSFKIVSYEPLALTLAEDKGVWNIIKATATGGGGDYEYSIDGVNFSTKNEFKIYKTGTYTITVRDKNGCTVSQDYYIKYIDVCLDNYFTPNGDGVYDTWGPGCTNIYDKLEFSIFDRYGRIIAKYHYGQKWDGRYNGAELPSGDYWYVLKLNDENDAREFVGHFTLYR